MNNLLWYQKLPIVESSKKTYKSAGEPWISGAWARHSCEQDKAVSCDDSAASSTLAEPRRDSDGLHECTSRELDSFHPTNDELVNPCRYW